MDHQSKRAGLTGFRMAGFTFAILTFAFDGPAVSAASRAFDDGFRERLARPSSTWGAIAV